MSLSTLNATGRVTADLEMQKSQQGKEYLRFGLAVNKGFGKNAKTDYYQCWTKKELGDRMIRAGVRKGSAIEIVGDLRINYYDKTDGTGREVSANINLYDWEYALSNTTKHGETALGNLPAQNEQSQPQKPDFVEHTLSGGELPL